MRTKIGELTLPEQTMLPAARDGGLVDVLAKLSGEQVWLAELRSVQTRRAYRLDVRHFVVTLGLGSADELRQVDRAAVIFWREAWSTKMR